MWQLLGRIAIMDTICKPFVIALQLTPKVALISLFIVLFGFGMEAKIIVATVLTFFPVFSNAYLGAQSQGKGRLDRFEVNKATRWNQFRLLVFPSSLLFILTGAEMAIVLAIVGAVVAKFIAGNKGLSYLALVNMRGLKVDELFAVVISLAVVGFLLYFAVDSVSRIAIPWHESVRS